MKSKFVFTDITTNEQFIVTCLPHEVHSIRSDTLLSVKKYSELGDLWKQ